MEWDITKVFTAVNADQLKVGSKVIAADSLAELKFKVKEVCDSTCYLYTDEIKSILSEEFYERFEVEGKATYTLCYLITEPEEKCLRWTDLKLGDIVTKGTRSYIVTGIDKKGKWDSHILFGNEWMTDENLQDWEKINC